jgi:hypothetical protein
METASMLQFAAAARSLAREARTRGLVAPGFRSPPAASDIDRSLRRRSGWATVAVRVKGRPWPAVLSDMIEGVVVANRLTGPAADQLRRELWSAVEAGPPARAA